MVNIFTIGDDWKGKFDLLEKYCKVVYIERTPEISTSIIKNDLRYKNEN
jgi:glycerol-3-phosphate cytidylyltransferase